VLAHVCLEQIDFFARLNPRTRHEASKLLDIEYHLKGHTVFKKVT
jgi:hypothetical protein